MNFILFGKKVKTQRRTPEELAQTPHQSPCGCPIIHSYTETQMFSDNTCIKLKELLELLNLSSSDSTKLYNLMQDAYRDGFDYGCIRSSEEMVSLGTLADMTVQQLANLIGTDTP